MLRTSFGLPPVDGGDHSRFGDRATTARSGAQGGGRRLRAAPFPISIDSAGWEELARREDIQTRARRLRAELDDPEIVLLGVDRLDYTKGIVHRLRAYGELLEEGELDPSTPSWSRSPAPAGNESSEYQRLRDEVESIVGRINGDYSSVGRTAIRYLHQSFPKEEMAALYLAADVMLVTPLRDGMNLVAKEYVACHPTCEERWCSPSSPVPRTNCATPSCEPVRSRRGQGHHPPSRPGVSSGGAPNASATAPGHRIRRSSLGQHVSGRSGYGHERLAKAARTAEKSDVRSGGGSGDQGASVAAATCSRILASWSRSP